MKLTTARTRPTRRTAFTLLEVLVVVAILVILAGVASVATMRYLEDARKTKAQLGCKSLHQACESYQTNVSNAANDFPSELGQLLNPPWGGTSYLKNGQEDLADPWGQPYQMKLEQQGDGNTTLIIYTIAKDGTPVSNHGVGPLARMQ